MNLHPSLLRITLSLTTLNNKEQVLLDNRMNDAKKTLLSLSAQKKVMLETLITLCHINSGSTHIQGLARMADALNHLFSSLADTIERISLPPITAWNLSGTTEQQPIGDILWIRKRPLCPKRILLVGHMDTVYPADSLFQEASFKDNNTLQGPGVADMKGGLVLLYYALLHFENTEKASSLGWDIFINADEEIGSLGSMDKLLSFATQSQIALVLEPSLDPQGTLARNRFGSGKFTIIAQGNSAHVGRAFAQGKNAIVHLAQALLHIHAINSPTIIVNVGQILGGEAVNVVPARAISKIDVRIQHQEDQKTVLQSFDHITKTLQQAGYTLEIHGGFYRPVKRVNAASKRLFSLLQSLGKTLHTPLEWQDTGGCCDGNNLSQQGIAVLDNLGVRGAHIHTSQEVMYIDSLVERAALLSTLLSHLATSKEYGP